MDFIGVIQEKQFLYRPMFMLSKTIALFYKIFFNWILERTNRL